MALLVDPIFLFWGVDREHVEEGGTKDCALHEQLSTGRLSSKESMMRSQLLELLLGVRTWKDQGNQPTGWAPMVWICPKRRF